MDDNEQVVQRDPLFIISTAKSVVGILLSGERVKIIGMPTEIKKDIEHVLFSRHLGRGKL